MGYDKQRFIDEIPEAFLCSICLDVLKEARTCSNCEGVICFQCLLKCQQRKPEVCPISSCENSSFLRLHAILRNQLLKFRLKCQNYNQGCQQVLILEKMQEHEQNCDFNQIACQNCQINLIGKDFKSHSCIEYLKAFTNELRKRLNQYCRQSAENLQILSETKRIEEHYKSILHENQQFVKKNQQLEEQYESLKMQNEVLKEKVKQQIGEIKKQSVKISSLRVSSEDTENKIEALEEVNQIKCTSARLLSDPKYDKNQWNNSSFQSCVINSSQQDMQISNKMKQSKKKNNHVQQLKHIQGQLDEDQKPNQAQIPKQRNKEQYQRAQKEII